MRELKPYKTKHGLRKALDNGGRFYNFFSSADDSVVSRAELAKAAGVYTASMDAFLFLEMAQQDLPLADRNLILDLLDAGLQKAYQLQKPILMLPSAVENEGSAGKSLIVTGYPRFVEERTQISGFIMVPIMVGKVLVPIMMPVHDMFDLYEVFDDRDMLQPNSLIANVRGKRIDHDGAIRFGGVLKKFETKVKTENSHKFYLETLYYTKL